MDLSENTITLLNIVITALIAIVTSIITSIYSTKAEKQVTSRLIFDKCYTKIYTLVEYDLFSKEMTLQKTRQYGLQIIELCNAADNYYFPSVKVHAEWLRDSTENDFQERWQYFSERFSMRYDIVCKNIGLPLRNRAYRLNRKQYINKWHYFRLYTLNDWPTVLFLLFLIALLVLMRLSI